MCGAGAGHGRSGGQPGAGEGKPELEAGIGACCVLGMQRPAACKRACRKAACPTLRCGAQSTWKHLTHAALRCPSICCAAACPLTHAALRCAAGEGNAAAVRPPQGLQPGHGPQHGQLQGALGALRCAVPAWPHRWMVADTAVGREGTLQLARPKAACPNTCTQTPAWLHARTQPQPLLALLPASRQGYAFCEYLDVSVTDAVIQALNGKPIGNKFLTGGSPPPPPSPPCPGGSQHALWHAAHALLQHAAPRRRAG